MKVQIYGKNITVTPAIAEKIEKKLNMLNKYFIIAEDDTANVVVRVYPAKQKIEDHISKSLEEMGING